MTTALRIHHATAGKAERLGVSLAVEGDRYVAVDTLRDPDLEFGGASAPELLERVLSLRPNHRRSDDEQEDGEQEDGEQEDGEQEAEEDGEQEAEEAEEAEEAGGSVVPAKYKVRYAEFDGTCGDLFAETLSIAGRNAQTGELDMNACRQVAADNGLESDWERWTAVQTRGFGGRARMNLGNRLRSAVRRGDTVVIGRTTFQPVLDADGKPIKGEFHINKPRGALR